MLDKKVIIEQLPIGGDNHIERRIFSEKGEMAQILNRTDEAFRQLVYWELDSIKSDQERGHHCHQRRIERIYVLTGELQLLLEDIENSVNEKVIIKAGDRVTISPKVAHAYRSLTYSQVLEYSSEPYNPTDTHPHKVLI
jgi:mannose-6-phosphate isomerase-like protein (cupin superfamily)